MPLLRHICSVIVAGCSSLFFWQLPALYLLHIVLAWFVRTTTSLPKGLLRLIMLACLRCLHKPDLKHFYKLVPCMTSSVNVFFQRRTHEGKIDSHLTLLANKMLISLLRSAVDPVPSVGSTWFGDVKNHIRGACMSQRGPERGQEGRASQTSAWASSNSARTIDWWEQRLLLAFSIVIKTIITI